MCTIFRTLSEGVGKFTFLRVQRKVSPKSPHLHDYRTAPAGGEPFDVRTPGNGAPYPRFGGSDRRETGQGDPNRLGNAFWVCSGGAQCRLSGNGRSASGTLFFLKNGLRQSYSSRSSMRQERTDARACKVLPAALLMSLDRRSYC